VANGKQDEKLEQRHGAYPQLTAAARIFILAIE
jgi:hypothetical protein